MSLAERLSWISLVTGIGLVVLSAIALIALLFYPSLMIS